MNSILFSHERHQHLADLPWNSDIARKEIEFIVRETESALRPHNWWPAHPRDEQPTNSPPEKTVYCCATGVLWALEYLARQGVATLSRDYRDLWPIVWEDYRSTPDTGAEVPSWFLGQSAILLTRMLKAPAEYRIAAAERLHRVISDNIANPTWEILWGSPGTMLAALFAYEYTNDSQWSDLYLRNADRLLDEWVYQEKLESYMWTQDLYGRKGIIYGAGHGFVGNAFALLRGVNLFSEARRRTIITRVADTTVRLAMRASGLANWPTRPAEDLKPGHQTARLQYRS